MQRIEGTSLRCYDRAAFPEEFSLHTDAAGIAPPDAFGRFRVLHQIGAGALGPVFRAFDPEWDRLVAVKLFRLDLPPERVHQLAAEFEQLIAAGLTHPAIVAPVAAGIDGVSAYLAQDYVAGDSLDVTLRQGPASPADALRVATHLAGALDAAAAIRIDHGTLHPRDVLLFADEARLTGLGIARALERVGVSVPVRRPYAAPERTVGNGRGPERDGRADIFGLAALTHEMLWGGRLNATGDEAAASLTEIAGGDLARLREVFRRALADRPDRRFDTALEFARALKAALPAVGGRVSRLPAGTPAPDHRRSTGIEARLPLEPPVAEPVDLQIRLPDPPRFADVEPGTAMLTGTLATTMLDSDMADERSQSGISPLAFALVIGAALGFAAGFGVGAWSRSDGPSGVPSAAAALGTPSGNAIVSDTGIAVSAGSPAREFTDATVTGEELRLSASGVPRAGPTSGSREWDPRAAAALGAPVSARGARYGETSPKPGEGGNPDATSEGRPDAQPAARPFDEAVARERVEGRQAQDVLSSSSEDLVERPLTPAATTVAGSLLVRSTPLGARVIVDGREYGRTPVTVGNLARGAHRVRVSRDGYVADERRVTITSAQRAHSITVRLSPERGPQSGSRAEDPERTAPANNIADASIARPTVGVLTVESRPPGANVFIDGQLVGTTPLVLPGVPAGEHAIHLDRDGYKRWASSVRIVPLERNRVAASLDR